MLIYRLSVPGMVCGGALECIERSLRSLAPVSACSLDPLLHAIQVEVTTECLDQVVGAVERSGYQVTDRSLLTPACV